MAVAKINEILQRCIRLFTHLLNRAFTAVGMGIHGAGINKDEVFKMSGKHALHPQQGMQSATA